MSDHSNSVKLGRSFRSSAWRSCIPGPITHPFPDHSGREPSGPASDRLFEHFDPRRLVVIGLAETTFWSRWTRTCGGSALTRCWSIRSQR